MQKTAKTTRKAVVPDYVRPFSPSVEFPKPNRPQDPAKSRGTFLLRKVAHWLSQQPEGTSVLVSYGDSATFRLLAYGMGYQTVMSTQGVEVKRFTRCWFQPLKTD